MNLIEAVITEILSKPYEVYGKYWVDVKIDAYGHESETTIMFYTWEAADSVKVGHKTVV